MRLPVKIRLLVSLALVLQAAGLASAEEKAIVPSDVKESLHMLMEKKEREADQLKRLAESILIPAGEFRMGNAEGEDDEKPAHRVFVRAFSMDKYEVTQLQYETAMGENPSYFKNCPLCPVEKVTFHNALAYCEKVGKRLPTEAEWEIAAKGGIDDVFYWDGDHPDGYAWFGNNSEHHTHPVGLKKPNAFGLHDMAGNVWEWVQDWYDGGYYENSPGENPAGPKEGNEKVVRGGAWGYQPELLTHTLRERHDPGTRYINGGFRCAADTGN